MGRRPAFKTDAVLTGAQDAFWANGFEGTSMDDLLKATGLSKSSLYSSFGTKEQLFLSAFDKYRDDRAQEMRDLLATQPGLPGVRTFFQLIIERDPESHLGYGCLSMNQGFEQAHRGLLLLGATTLAAQAVERLVACRRGEPRGRAPGHAVARPSLEREHGRVLQGILGELQVAELPGEGGQRAPTLDPDQLAEIVVGATHPIGSTGRTSMCPCHAPGICAAQRIASSRSFASSR